MNVLDRLLSPFRGGSKGTKPEAGVASAGAKPEVRVASTGKGISASTFAKARRAAQRNFQAGMIDRINGSWTTTALTADEIIDKNWRVLVARSREQMQANDYAKKFRTLIRSNVIGSNGIQLQAKVRDPNGDIDTLASQAIEDDWWKWGRRGNCDVTGKLSWLQVMNMALDSACSDGEFIAIMLDGEGPMGFSVQLIDPMRLDVDLKEELGNGKFIRHGIEFTPVGRPVAYYFTTLDEKSDTYWSFNGKKYQRVPAEDVIHEFLPEQIGQKRGLPWIATPLQRLKMLGGYEDAALVAARVGAAKMGVITPSEDAEPPEDDPDIITDAEPGSFWVAPPGWKAEAFDLTYPSGEFAAFHKACLRGISAGLGVAYNNLANDLEGVNFSSIRQGTLDERETYKGLQSWVAEVFCDRIYGRWLRRRLLMGKLLVAGKPLKLEREEKYRAVTWQGRRWQWVDPQSEMEAAVKGVSNRFMSKTQVIMDQGRDPEEVEAELLAEEQAADARTMQRVLGLQRACEVANKAAPGLNLHWSQIITIGGAATAPGAYLQAVAQNVQASAGADGAAAGGASKPSTNTKPKE